MKILDLTKRQATIFVEPDGTAYAIPHIAGGAAWIPLAIMGASAVMGAAQERESIKGMKAQPLSPEEKEIISLMENLAMEDPEIGKQYAELTKQAFKGEYVSPGLEEDIATEEQRREERIRGLGTGVSATAARQARETGAESADILRENARQEMMQLGQQLLASRTGRIAGAAGTALAPLSEYRKEVYDVESAKARRKAGSRAGLVGAAGQIGTALAVGGK